MCRWNLLQNAQALPDILMARRMLASHWRLDSEPERTKVIEARLGLILAGLRA